MVAALYRTFFDNVAVHAERFNFANLAWGTEELKQLAEVFPRFCACKELILRDNEFLRRRLREYRPVRPE